MRGRKPTPRYLKLIKGNPGRRPLPSADDGPQPVGDLVKQPKLEGRASELWDATAAAAPWLTAADAGLLLIYCRLQAEFESNPGMVTSRIATLRGVASELGLSPVGRMRMGRRYQDPEPRGVDVAEQFLARRKR